MINYFYLSLYLRVIVTGSDLIQKKTERINRLTSLDEAFGGNDDALRNTSMKSVYH